MNPRWIVIELTPKGAVTVHNSTNFEDSRSAYEALDNAKWVEAYGRDESGNLTPGVQGENIHLGRKIHGVEVVEGR